jgi:hypothetical protein
MEKVLYSEDLFPLILEFLPINSKFIIHKVCKFFNKYKFNMCLECNKVVKIPIETNNKIYCIDCLNKKDDFIYHVTKKDKEFWIKIEFLEENININCKYCGLKCNGHLWTHYHLYYYCKIYKKILKEIISD